MFFSKARVRALVLALVVGVELLAEADFAQAQNVDRRQSAMRQIGDFVSLEVYGGYLSGQSRELVYDPATGLKQSELFWKIQSAAIVGGTLSVQPFDWVTVKVSGWTPLQSRNRMDDYDWLVAPFQDWSDLSQHSDTRMHKTYQVDLAFAARIASFGRNQYLDKATINIVGGYRWFTIGWTAYGGNFIYSTGGGFRNSIGSFPPGEPGISYRQWVETPYLGIGGTVSKERWSFSGEVIGSLWAKAHDRDDHIQRSTLFEDDFSRMKMVGANVALSYRFNEYWSLVGRAEYQKYFEAKGPTKLTDYSTGTVSYVTGDAAGMDHYNFLLSIGLKAKLF